VFDKVIVLDAGLVITTRKSLCNLAELLGGLKIGFLEDPGFFFRKVVDRFSVFQNCE